MNTAPSAPAQCRPKPGSCWSPRRWSWLADRLTRLDRGQCRGRRADPGHRHAPADLAHRERGAAFGLLPGGGTLFLLVGFEPSPSWLGPPQRPPARWPHGGACSASSWAGTLGNLTDRLIGSVTDFVSVGIEGPGGRPSTWPTRRWLSASSVSCSTCPSSTAAAARARVIVSEADHGWAAPAGRVDVAVAGVAGYRGPTPSGCWVTVVRWSTDGCAGPATGWPAASCSRSRSPRPDPTLVPEDIPLRVVYEDDDLLVVDKPAGMVVHPSVGHPTGTLVHALLGRSAARDESLGSVAGVGRPGIVHRLDRDTSGLLVVAKTDAAQASLMAQFGSRAVEKGYLALVPGRGAGGARPDRGTGRRDPRDRQRMAVVAGGRQP